MLEHLDDPSPWRPDAGCRRRIVDRGRRLRRRRRLVSGIEGTTVTVVLAGIAGLLYVDHRCGAIERVGVATPAPIDGARTDRPTTASVTRDRGTMCDRETPRRER